MNRTARIVSSASSTRNYFSDDGFSSLLTRRSSIEMTTKFWALMAGFVIIGYLCMTRSFAYLGIKALNIFIGEMVLGLFLLTRTRDMLGRWFGALMSETKLSTLAWVYYIFAGYGVMQVIRGIAAGYSPLTALQNMAFHVYPLYIFIGLWVGSRYPNYLRKLFRWLAWCHGIYGILYIVVLNPTFSDLSTRSEEVAVFGQPAGSALAILGLLCFEPKLRPVIIPLLINAFLLLAMQVRGDWLGFAVGFVIWGVLSRKIGGMLAGAGAIIVLLGIGYVADFNLPAPSGRGGEISTRNIIGRGLSAIDAEEASKYSETAAFTAGTVEWRTNWWEAIWNSIHETNTTTLFGHGYGFPITGLVSYMEGHTNDRSPHSIFFFCLAYSGWTGVIIFFVFQFTILKMHWMAHKLTKRPFGAGYLAMCVATAFFGNYFETPFGAIPYYLITGLAIAPIFSKQFSAFSFQFSARR